MKNSSCCWSVRVPDNPIDGSRSETDRAAENTRVRRSLRHVFLKALEQHLVESESVNPASWIAALKGISDEDLLSIGLCSAALRDELLRRADDAIRADRLTESTLHLLLQARHCESQIRVTGSARSLSDTTTGTFEEQFAELIGLFRNRLAAAAVRVDFPLRPHPAALDLLAVVQAELLPASATAESPDPRRVLAEKWSAWQDRSWSVVPVNPVAATTSPQQNERRLLPRCREDRFLSAWRWSAFLEPSVMAGRSLLQPTDPPFTIDGGMFDSLTSGDDGLISRFGSVLLVRIRRD